MNIKKVFLAAAVVVMAAPNYGFKSTLTEQDWVDYANRCLTQCYNHAAEPKLKKVEISITDDDFIRLRKTFAKNKQVYYSFNLHKFNELDYVGSASKGILKLETVADNVIVQTYNDRHGDVDSMSTFLNIPVKNMAPGRLDSLKQAFNYFKSKEL
jgi:hypothetical protein